MDETMSCMPLCSFFFEEGREWDTTTTYHTYYYPVVS